MQRRGLETIGLLVQLLAIVILLGSICAAAAGAGIVLVNLVT